MPVFYCGLLCSVWLMSLRGLLFSKGIQKDGWVGDLGEREGEDRDSGERKEGKLKSGLMYERE